MSHDEHGPMDMSPMDMSPMVINQWRKSDGYEPMDIIRWRKSDETQFLRKKEISFFVGIFSWVCGFVGIFVGSLWIVGFLWVMIDERRMMR